MSWWKNILSGEGQEDRVDYYEEGLTLMAAGSFHDALTSFRLALKDSTGDPVILQQIAIAYTRIGMTEEAAKTYRHVLQRDPGSPGALYGLAFLLLRSGMADEAIEHLEGFLAHAPQGAEAAQHVAHARTTLERVRRGDLDEHELPGDPTSERGPGQDVLF